MAGISIWHIIVLMFSAELSQAAQKILIPCIDSSPPCIYTQASSQNTCRGDNSSLSTDFELPLSHTALITVTNIGIYRGSDPIFLGVSKIPGFEGHGRWKISHKLSYITDKTGLLTVMIDVDNVQLDDEFMAHIEIGVAGQVLKTSDQIWFKVNDNCSLQDTNQLKDEIYTENLNELHASVQLLLQTAENSSLEFRNVIDEIHSKSFISSNMTNTNLSANDVASTLTSTMLNVMILLILIGSLILGGMLMCKYVKHKKTYTLKEKSNIKDSEAINMLMQRKHESVNVDDKIRLVRAEEIEQAALERYDRLQKQLDEINDSHKLMKSQQATQDEKTMNGFDRLERLQKMGYEKMPRLEKLMGEIEQAALERSDRLQKQLDEINDSHKLMKSRQETQDARAMNRFDGLERLVESLQENVNEKMLTLEKFMGEHEREKRLGEKLQQLLDKLDKEELARLCRNALSLTRVESLDKGVKMRIGREFRTRFQPIRMNHQECMQSHRYASLKSPWDEDESSGLDDGSMKEPSSYVPSPCF